MNAENEKVVNILKEITQYVIDATFMIEQGISSLSDESAAKEKLNEIKAQYEKDIEKFSEMISRHGGQPPEHSRDFKGFFMQGYVGMRGLLSDKGTLKALKTNTDVLSNVFEKTIKNPDLPEEDKSEINSAHKRVIEFRDYFQKEINR